jgi:shikimate kinase
MDNRTEPLTTREIEALARRIDRPIVLVGMMGVGKTSVGKRLAAALGSTFVDADEEIETAARMTIPEIFAQFGEAAFRDGERRVIARLIEQGGNHTVIATGGGAFSQAESRALILEKTISVWLDSDIDTLVERTARKNNRPLLQGGDRRETLTRLRAERQPDYAQAKIHVMSNDGPHTKTIDNVLKGIAEWL